MFNNMKTIPYQLSLRIKTMFIRSNLGFQKRSQSAASKKRIPITPINPLTKREGKSSKPSKKPSISLSCLIMIDSHSTLVSKQIIWSLFTQQGRFHSSQLISKQINRRKLQLNRLALTIHSSKSQTVCRQIHRS